MVLGCLRQMLVDPCERGCWKLYASGLEKAHIPASKYGCTRDRPWASMPHSLQSRLDCGYRFFSYQNKTVSTFSGEKTIAVVDFCQQESINILSDTSKVQPFMSKFVRLACAQNSDTFLEHLRLLPVCSCFFASFGALLATWSFLSTPFPAKYTQSSLSPQSCNRL